MKSAEYWAGRMERLNENMMQKADALLPDIQGAYEAAAENIQQQIESFYQRYAGQEGITLAEAKRLLSPAERTRFGLTVQEYVRIGKSGAVAPEWVTRLELESARYRVTRLEALRLQIRQQVELLEGRKAEALTKTLGEIFRECQYQTAYEIQRGLGIGAAFATIDTKTINKVLAKPWAADGKTFSDRIWGDDRGKLLHTLETTLTTGIITGESPQKTIDKVRKAMGSSRAAAGRLVLTEGAAFAAMARQDCYAELGVGKYEFLATLDAKTCGICAAMDGQVFDLADYEIGVTAPPLHPNDRCTTVPHVEGEGFAIGERAAKDGDGKTYYVPANMTYPEWKKAFVEGGNKSGLKVTSAKGSAKVALKYKDVTGEYMDTATPNSHTVQDLQSYTVNDVTYIVSGSSVVLDYSLHEKEIAELLEQKLGGEIFMVPRVNSPQGISTPDYLFRGQGYDLKTIGKDAGDNTIWNRIKKAKKQANNFVIDVTKAKQLPAETIDKQIEKIFNDKETLFVKEIIIVCDDEIIKIARRT